jgi:protein gp37
MGENSKIEWCDHTFNPWIGCQKVSPGCDYCYAEAMMDHRYKRVQWGPHGERVRTSEANWRKPLQWDAKARMFREQNGHRPRVFCASLADIFDNRVDIDWRAELFDLIRECRRLDWLILTKRPENIEKMLPADWGKGYSNVWLGTTAEDQMRFDARWKRLKRVPAALRFISYEPALGPLQLPAIGALPDWLISGGESGTGARPLKPQWIRDIIADCCRYGVAPFHKQWGSYSNNPLVVEQGMTARQAREIDPDGKGGGLVDGELVRDFPDQNSMNSAKTR